MTWYYGYSVLTRSVIAGSALGVPFVLPWLWPLSMIGVLLVLIDLHSIPRRQSALWYGWRVFTIKSLLALAWFWSVYPIDWLSISFGSFELVLIGLYWLTAAAWLGTGGAVVGLVLKLLSPRTLWAVPAVWVIGELTGSLVFSLLTYGPGGSITTAFSFGYLGYALAQSNGFFWLAHIAGVYGLTIAATLLGYLLWLLWQRWPLQRPWLLIGSIVLFSVTNIISLPQSAVNSRTTTVAIIDTELSWSVYDVSNTPEAHRATLQEAVAAAVEAKTDYILLPEESRFFVANDTLPAHVAAWRFLHGNPNTILIDSGAVPQADGSSVVRASVVAGATGETAVVDKVYLVPQGEYIPSLYRWLLVALGQKDVLPHIENVMNFRPGQAGQATLAPTIPAVLFCFESVSPLSVRSLLVERPDVPFVFHPVAHGWFNEPVLLWQQLDTMLRIQAAWSQVAIVSAGNQVAGQLYLPNGHVITPEVIKRGVGWELKQATVPLR